MSKIIKNLKRRMLDEIRDSWKNEGHISTLPSEAYRQSKIGAVLVIGGGIAGMQASLDLADSGFKVYIVDTCPAIGGAMAQLDKTFPTNDCSMCIMAPKLVETGRHRNIELITNAEIEKVEGDVGDFTVTVRKGSRKVDETKCTGCGICKQRCPVELPDEYNRGLKLRKAIYVRYPQAVPPVHVIDQEACIGCGICQEMCEAEAIVYDQEDTKMELHVGSIILSPGFEEFNLLDRGIEYGYGRFPNVVSTLELERMESATGPYNGLVLRPSDGEIPKKVAFIQCVGSRDRTTGNPYCSSVCCMFAIKEAIIAQEHTPGLRSTIFFMDMRAFGKEFDDYYTRAEEEHGVRFIKNNRISGIEEDPDTHNLIIRYIEEGELKEEEFGMVALSVGMESPKDAKELGERLGIELNDYDFCTTSILSPLETSRRGIYVCGAFNAPKDIPDSVAQASGAAARASHYIASERGKLETVRELPPEKDVSDEKPRIGVFVCHCGINIGGVVNVFDVTEYAKTLPNVVYAEDNLYTCSQDTQEKIKEKIKEHNLNRIVVASCTPRTHAPLFMNTIREGGLNPYLFEMANIRDQCSWVHSTTPEEATQKAKDLVRMASAKANLLEQLPKISIDVKPSGLIIGGGLSGMTAALELAGHGFDAYIIERSPELGGNLRKLHYELGGVDLEEYLEETVDLVNSNRRIHVYKNAVVTDVYGYIGNFKTTINHNGEEKEIEHGVIIVATGGIEYTPTEYLYGKDESVITQLDLEEKLAKGGVDANKVVMIQCVGSRIPERTYRSRVCCTEAIKNALYLKEQNPDAEIYILFKDMRTYGFREKYYEEAAKKGIVFVRYDDENPPKVTSENGLKVVVKEHFIGVDLLFKPDLLVLSAATIQDPSNEELSKILKVPLSKDGFFLEAHMKLRPVEFATEGIFLCGLAHSPKFLEECTSQASGAVSRAATILSNKTYEAEPIVSWVDEKLCTSCGICVAVCPYGAIEFDEDDIARVNEVLCKGCGTCGATCINRAIKVHNFTDDQLIAQVMSALEVAV